MNLVSTHHISAIRTRAISMLMSILIICQTPSRRCAELPSFYTTSIIHPAISVIALGISAGVGYLSWRNRDESRKARDFSVMLRILDEIDNDKARKDREYI